jgi:hypothetical protein
MRHKILTASSLAMVILAGVTALSAQSLGDIARQERAKREREKPGATKVWTNDNIPRAARIEPVTSGPQSTAAEPASPETVPQGAPPANPQTAAEEDKKHNKDYWQARFKTARAGLASAQERQHLAEDEVNLLQIQAVRELDPAAKQDLEAKVEAKSGEVGQARGVTEKAQKALDDLQKEFDASGAPEEWSKTD